MVLSSFAVVYILSINLSEEKSQFNSNSIISSINSAANSLNILLKNLAENDAIKAVHNNQNMPFWEVDLLAKKYFTMDVYNLSQNVLFSEYSLTITNNSFTIGTTPMMYSYVDPLGISAITSTPAYITSSGSISYKITNLMTGEKLNETADLSMIIPKSLPWLIYQESRVKYDTSDYGLVNRIAEYILQNYYYNVSIPSSLSPSFILLAIKFGIYLDDAIIYRNTPNITLNNDIKSIKSKDNVNVLSLWNEWYSQVEKTSVGTRNDVLPNPMNPYTLNLSSFGQSFTFMGNISNIASTSRNFEVNNIFSILPSNIVEIPHDFSDIYNYGGYRYGAEVYDIFVQNASVYYETESVNSLDPSSYNFTIPLNLTFRVFNYVNSTVQYNNFNFNSKSVTNVEKFGYEDAYPNGHEPVLFQNYFADLLSEYGNLIVQVENNSDILANNLPSNTQINIMLDGMSMGIFYPNMFNKTGEIVLPNIPAGNHLVEVGIFYTPQNAQWGKAMVSIENKSIITNMNGGGFSSLNVYMPNNTTATIIANGSMDFGSFMVFQMYLLSSVPKNEWLSYLAAVYSSLTGYYFPSYLYNLNRSNPVDLERFIEWDMGFVKWLNTSHSLSIDDSIELYSLWMGIKMSAALWLLQVYNDYYVEKSSMWEPGDIFGNLTIIINYTFKQIILPNGNIYNGIVKTLDLVEKVGKMVDNTFKTLFEEDQLYKYNAWEDGKISYSGYDGINLQAEDGVVEEGSNGALSTIIDSDSFESAMDEISSISDVFVLLTAPLAIYDGYMNLTEEFPSLLKGNELSMVIAVKDIGNIAIGILSLAEIAVKMLGSAPNFGDAIAGPLIIIAGVVVLAQLVSTIMEKYHTSILGALGILATGQAGWKYTAAFYLTIVVIGLGVVMTVMTATALLAGAAISSAVPVIGWIASAILLIIFLILNWNTVVNFIENLPSIIYNWAVGGDEAISITSGSIKKLEGSLTYVLNQTLKLSASLNSENLANNIESGYYSLSMSFSENELSMLTTNKTLSQIIGRVSNYEQNLSMDTLNATYAKYSLQWSIINTWHSIDDLLNLSTEATPIWGWVWNIWHPIPIYTIVGYSETWHASNLFGKDNIEPFNNSHVGNGYFISTEYLHEFVGNIFVNSNTTSGNNYLESTISDYSDDVNAWPSYFNPAPANYGPYLSEVSGDIAKLLTTVQSNMVNNLSIHFVITGGPKHNEITLSGLNGWITSLNYTAQNLTYWNSFSAIANSKLQYVQNFGNVSSYTGEWGMLEVNVNASISATSFTISPSNGNSFNYFYYNYNSQSYVNGNAVQYLSISYTQIKSIAGMPFYIYLTPGTYTISWIDSTGKQVNKQVSLLPYEYPSFYGNLSANEVNINSAQTVLNYGNLIINTSYSSNEQFTNEWAADVSINNSTDVYTYNSTTGGAFAYTIPSSAIKAGDSLDIILNLNISGINGYKGWKELTIYINLTLFSMLNYFGLHSVVLFILPDSAVQQSNNQLSNPWYLIQYG
ncbi:MAG: hypothetical protein ACP5UL_06015 [Thermoplasmata archaeon]